MIYTDAVFCQVHMAMHLNVNNFFVVLEVA